MRDTLHQDVGLRLFSVFCGLVWGLWLLKVLLSRGYRPVSAPYHCTTTVVVPVVDEPIDLFRQVLGRVVAQRPDQVIVVINGPRNPALEEVVSGFASIDCEWTSIASKRNAIRIGVERAVGDVVVLLDSDTLWTPGTLPELVKPFADPRVGGVTTAQRILDHRRSVITRWADWLENSRAKYSMPAQSVLGAVGCLPGRTIAFRRDVLERAMPAFLTGRFLGVFLEVSDDRTLTNLALKQGYRTVYQSTSLVYTDAPLRWRTLSKQQLRWARGSQYNTLRMLPWMTRHTPLLAVFFLADIVLPFLLLGAVIGAAYRVWSGEGTNYYTAFLSSYGWSHGLLLLVALTVTASALSMSIRQFRHLRERPLDLLWMPVFVLISSLFLMPIRLLGFFRMAHAGSWGTRNDSYTAGPDPVHQRETYGVAMSSDAGGVALAERARMSVFVGAAHRSLNAWAAVPYLIGGSVIALEVLYRG
ncbi:MAG: glycosyltransferase [Actinomycetes bacterium]